MSYVCIDAIKARASGRHTEVSEAGGKKVLSPPKKRHNRTTALLRVIDRSRGLGLEVMNWWEWGPWPRNDAQVEARACTLFHEGPTVTDPTGLQHNLWDVHVLTTPRVQHPTCCDGIHWVPTQILGHWVLSQIWGRPSSEHDACEDPTFCGGSRYWTSS